MINSHVKYDFIEKLGENAKKSELIYNKYKTDIKSYISYLNDVKSKNKRRRIHFCIKR